MRQNLEATEVFNEKVIISDGTKCCYAENINQTVTMLQRELNKYDINGKMIALCSNDGISSYLISRFLWINKCTIMYVNAQNGREYVEQILNHYSPHYYLAEEKYWKQNVMAKWSVLEKLDIEGRKYIFGPCGNGMECLKGRQGCVFFSSGTTAIPKAIFRSEKNMINDAISNIVTFDISSEDRLLVAVPFGHVYGLGSGVAPFAIKGATIFFAPSFMSGRALKKIIEDNEITAIIASPTVYQEILIARADLSRCRLMLSAGSKISSKLASDFFENNKKIINNMYGSSETGAIATLYGIEDTDTSNCGKPQFLVNVECDGTPEQVDVIRIKSDSLAEGMIVGGELKKIADETGWYETNDMGYIDENGCVHLICRKDDMINVGGEKLNPQMIENLVEQYYPKALVLTEAMESGGNYPVLYIESDDVDIAFLTKMLKERLSYKFMPKKIYSLSEFPKNAGGKIDRKQLRSIAKAQEERIDMT